VSGGFLKTGRLFCFAAAPPLAWCFKSQGRLCPLKATFGNLLSQLHTQHYLFTQNLPGMPLAVLVFIIGGGLAVPAFAFNHHMAMFKGK
jgi:hypothetical protein